MHTDPRYRLREVRLARALAGSELEGLRAIEEIRSVSRLAQLHTEQTGRDEADLLAIDGALRTIQHQARRAEDRYSKVLEAVYEFLNLPDDGEDEPEDAEPEVEAVGTQRKATQRPPRRGRP